MNYKTCQILVNSKKETNLFIPWSSTQTPNLMFEQKRILINQGHCLIPYIDIDGSKGEMLPEQFEQLVQELENGKEIKLYMSNLDSLHVYQIKSIMRSPNNISHHENVSSYFKKFHPKFWIIVSDVFVLETKYKLSKKSIEESLFGHHEQNLQMFGVFRGKFELDGKNVERWVEFERSISPLYLMKQNELKENNYLGVWETLHEASKHFLTESEKMRQESFLLIGQEKAIKQQRAFDFYKMAVIFEFNKTIVFPFVDLYQQSDSLKEIIKKLFKQNADLGSYKFLNEKKVLLDIPSIQDFLKKQKSFFFTLSNKYQKKIEEEPLKVEAVIKKISMEVDILLARNFSEILDRLYKIEMLSRTITDLYVGGLDEIGNYKFTKILSQILSEKGENNPFYLIHQDHLKKDYVKRNIDQEIKDLESNHLKKSA